MESDLPPDPNPPPPASPPPPPAPPPPFHRPPPVIAPLPVARPAKRSGGWMIAAIVILLVLLVMSVLFNFQQIFRTSVGRRVTSYRSTFGPRFEEVTLRE